MDRLIYSQAMALVSLIEVDNGRSTKNPFTRWAPKEQSASVRTHIPIWPPPRRQSDLWICLLLIVAVFGTYGQVLYFDFVSYDDPDYVTANAHVQAGLSWAGAIWAFGSSSAGN